MFAIARTRTLPKQTFPDCCRFLLMAQGIYSYSPCHFIPSASGPIRPVKSRIKIKCAHVSHDFDRAVWLNIVRAACVSTMDSLLHSERCIRERNTFTSVMCSGWKRTTDKNKTFKTNKKKKSKCDGKPNDCTRRAHATRNCRTYNPN